MSENGEDYATRVDVSASYMEYKNFLESRIWKDLSGEIEKWLDDARTSLELEAEENMIRKLQGISACCRQVLMLPAAIVEMFEDNLQENRNGNGL